MNRKEELRRLYSQSFDESEGYLDFFYNRRYKDNAVTIEQDGKIVSALYYFDRKMQIGQNIVKASFVSAAATLPELRGRGILRDTLLKSFNGMRERGNILVYLYPFKHEYYKRFDFVTYSHMAEKKYISKKIMASQKDINVIKDLYYAYVRKFNCFTLRNECDFLEILDGIFADGGVAELLVDEQGKNIGYHLKDGSGELNEFVCISDSVFSGTGDSCFVPSYEGEQYSMARCLNVLELLKITEFLPQERVIYIKVKDELISQNNITVRIDLKNSEVKLVACSEHDYEMSVSEVTKCALGLPYGDFCAFFKRFLNINYEKY